MVITTASFLLAGCAGYQSLETNSARPPPSLTGQSTSSAGTSTPSHSTVGNQLQQVYERYHGTPYRYGGTTSAGFDCSGFIVTAYREGLNTPLPRTTGMMLDQGRFVRRDQLQEGDIVFFRIGGKEQHAGIYLGNNRFIHSASSVGVTESSLGNAYWQQRYSQARRFL
jgi:cell wall-associated NlpC family hydrolase